jgi:hypothetical protein
VSVVPNRAHRQRAAQGQRLTCASPYGAPVLFAPKADGSLRFCIDTGAEQHHSARPSPPSHITELLDSLGGAKVFSTLDRPQGTGGTVHRGSRKTAFVTHLGQYSGGWYRSD